MKHSLHAMARNRLIEEGLFEEEEQKEEKTFDKAYDSPKYNSFKEEEFLRENLEESRDSILDHSFLYKNLVKDVHLMTKDELIEHNRKQRKDEGSLLSKEL